VAILQVHNDVQRLQITGHLNNFYRLVGMVVLLGSLYLLLYPEFTNRPILYRSE